MADRLRYRFDRCIEIESNYSQAYQDIFVLSVLGGRERGTFLEIGAQKPIQDNNTYLLHKMYFWNGVSIDIDPAYLSEWNELRPFNNFLVEDAIAANYNQILELLSLNRNVNMRNSDTNIFKNRIDYLQLDIDPSINTLRALKALPLSEFRFSVITFETDAYTNDLRARDESREILKSYGYELVGPGVSVLYNPISSEPIQFEDWWVDPLVVDAHLIDELKGLSAGKDGCLPQNLLFQIRD